MSLDVGGTYKWGQRSDTGEPTCVFVVLSAEPWEPYVALSGGVSTPAGFRILVLDGRIPDAILGDTIAGQQTVVARGSAVGKDSKPLFETGSDHESSVR